MKIKARHPDAVFKSWRVAVRKCGGVGGKPGPCPGGSSVVQDTPTINSVPMLHRTHSADKIRAEGFQPGAISMYGAGVYFSSRDVGTGYGPEVLDVSLKPHQQLAVDYDTDVPRIIQEITGERDYLSPRARQKMIDAGYGSLRFKVDDDTYTVVLDPSLIEHKKKK